MKVFGHPLHVILIHFPSALFPMDLACSLIAFFTANTSFTFSAFYATVGGVLAGWFAALAGAMDLVGVARSKPGSLNKALLHGSINSTVLIGFTVFAFVSFKHYPLLPVDSILMLSIKGVLVTLLIVGNYLGGSLILKDKIGIEGPGD